MEPDNNNNTSNNNNEDEKLGNLCDNSRHSQECELLQNFSKGAKQPVPREVSQLVLIVARMAEVVDKEEVMLLMGHLEARVQLPTWESTLQHVLCPLARLRPDLGDEKDLSLI